MPSSFAVYPILLCRTSLPLASTTWVRSSFQDYVHFPPASAIDKSLKHQNKFSGMLRIELGAAGLETRTRPRCYAEPPCVTKTLIGDFTLSILPPRISSRYQFKDI